METTKNSSFILRTQGEQHRRDVVCSETDKFWERECGRGSKRQKKGQVNPAYGWEMCQWEVSGHAK